MSQLDELREILGGENTDKLKKLEARVDGLENYDAWTLDVAEVLAPAIDKRIKENDDLVQALQEPVSQGLKTAIRLEPDVYAEILYPAISPSIRLAISQAISSMLVTINQTVESATTLSGIKTRIEAVRTGVPFAELLLSKSLLYRVEHLYLIERDSGMLIAELTDIDGGLLDSDAVSGMFSAIQSFVQDSFSGSDADRLTDFTVGAHNVWIAHGKVAMLACVIYGDAPESLKRQLYDTLDQIRTKYATQLANLDDDNINFLGVEEQMKPLLQVQLKEGAAAGLDESATQARAKLIKTIILMVALLAAGLSFAHWFDRDMRLATAKHYLQAEPGIIVTSATWQDDKIVIRGLRDPDAVLPLPILTAHKITLQNLSLQTVPFRSLDTDMELQRFNADLQPPAAVILRKNDAGLLQLQGSAPITWLLYNDLRIRQLASDKRLDISDLWASKESVQQFLDARLGNRPTPKKQEIVDFLSATSWHRLLPSEIMQTIAVAELSARESVR